MAQKKLASQVRRQTQQRRDARRVASLMTGCDPTDGQPGPLVTAMERDDKDDG